VEELLIFRRASGSSATRKLSFAGTWYYSRLSVHLLCTNPAAVQDSVHVLTRQVLSLS
jgi:glucan-binding YG repeat protein